MIVLIGTTSKENRGTDKLSAVRDTDLLNRITLIILKFIFRLNHESTNYARIFGTDYC